MATISHDRFFKEFFHRFLPAFLQLFFPQEAANLDFATLRFPDKELIINLPQQEVRIGDVIATAQTLTGEAQTIIIHIEVEGREKKSLPRRMFEYYSLLRLLENKMVLPLALVLLPGTDGLSWQTYQEILFGKEIVSFHYGQVGIRDLPAKVYAQPTNPVAAALAVLMKADGRGKAKWEKLAEVKLTALRVLLNDGDLTEGDKLFLMDLIERYLPAGQFPADLRGETMQALQETEMLWHEQVQYQGWQKGRQEGKQEGRQEGRQEGKQEILFRLLRRKFGVLPTEFVTQLRAVQDPALLDEIGEELLTAESLADIHLPTAVSNRES